MYIIYTSLVCILLLNVHICQIPIPCVCEERRDEEEEEQENIDDNGGGGSVKNDNDDDDDNKNNNNNKNNNSREGSNEVLSIHRQSKPKAHKHLHMFINDYYQSDAGVNHDSHHFY